MRVQSGDDCGGGGDYSGYFDNLDLRAEFADTMPVWDGRELPSLQGYYPDGRGRPSLRVYWKNSAGLPVNRSILFAVGGWVENRLPKLIPPKNG